MDSSNASLKFIGADRITTSAGSLDGAVLVSRSHAPFGKLDGVLVDPSLRRVQYYVVESLESAASRHYLVPSHPMRLDRTQRELEVDLDRDDIDQLDDVEPDTLPRFSDDDLLTALFRSQTH
jgi:hypothetical protein